MKSKIENRSFSKLSSTIAKGFLALLLVFSTVVYGQNKTITGKVVDPSGLPLPGVTIQESNTQNGTTTNFDGEFTLTVANNAQLVFSYVGFSTQTVQTGTQTTLNVVMQEDTESLDEVVLMGYSTQSKRKVIGAVSSVSAEGLEKIPVQNVGDALQGKVSGVSASPGSGDPGAAPVIRVRGLATINNNDPLYVIDGVPGDISSINSANISNVNILKDASASTIYGSRASNGVVVISTKRGYKDTPLTIALKSQYSVSSVDNKLSLANRDQYNTINTAAMTNDGQAPNSWTQGGSFADTDWQDELFKTGSTSDINLSVTGGGEDFNIYTAIGNFKQEGILLNTDFERSNFRVNSDYTKGKLKIGQSLAYVSSGRNRLSGSNESTSNSQNAGYPLIYEMLDILPHQSVYDPSNEHGFNGGHPDLPNSLNVVGLQSILTNEVEQSFISGNIFAEYEISEGLNFRLRYGKSQKNRFSFYHSPSYILGRMARSSNASYSEQRDETLHTTLNSVFTYSKTIGEHSIDALAGYSEEENSFKITGAGNSSLASNDLFSIGNSGDSSYGYAYESSLQSVFGKVDYSFSDKYLLGATVRRDGSSKFAENNRWGTFYAFSGGWRLSSEDFFESELINDLKLRASYGTLGNQNIDDYAFIPVVDASGALRYPFGDAQNPVQGAAVTKIAFNDLKWEESTSQNFGVDVALIDNKLNLSFDYFKIETSDMLVRVPIPESIGLNDDGIRNAGDMSNKGFEFSASYKNNDNEFQYEISANLSTSDNEVTKLGFTGDSNPDGYLDYSNFPTTNTVEGRPIGSFFLYETDGLFQTDAEVSAHGIQPNAQPGDVKYVDTNGDGSLNDEDRIFMGSGLPDFEYGASGNFTYKQWDMNIFFQGTQGNNMYNGAKRLLYQNTHRNYSTDLLNAWTPSNTNTNIPRNTIQDTNGNNALPSDRFLEDGSYLRLKNIQLGYTIENEMVNDLRVYLGAKNLFTITDYTGYDPSVVNYSTYARGVDRGLYPGSKSVYMGLSFNF